MFLFLKLEEVRAGADEEACLWSWATCTPASTPNLGLNALNFHVIDIVDENNLKNDELKNFLLVSPGYSELR